MNKFQNMLIVTDLDGTFFNSERKLVQKNLDAVEHFKAHGGLFAIASGREPLNIGTIGPIAAELTNAPSILANGAFTYDFAAETRHGLLELDYELTSEVVSRVRQEFPEMGIRISSCGGYYVPHVNRCVRRDLAPQMEHLLANGFYHESDIADTPRCGWFRVAFNDCSEELDRLRDFIEPLYGDRFAFNKAEAEIYEFQHKNATKGQALERLRRQLIESGKVDKTITVFAMGDFNNDLDMLMHCDIPACPANAIDSVKAVAKVQLCHCDDGAAADLISRIERGEIPC